MSDVFARRPLWRAVTISVALVVSIVAFGVVAYHAGGATAVGVVGVVRAVGVGEVGQAAVREPEGDVGRPGRVGGQEDRGVGDGDLRLQGSRRRRRAG